jgi:BirA family biotin operon repressor/biotin-[acetyl-CoA-carboxylase] ligase
MGRQWTAEAGGLWFTVALPLHGPCVGWGGMLAALAVCRALDDEGLRAEVKWPNDVVIGGRKLAGILVETAAGSGLAAVGVGLNVRNRLPSGVRGQSARGDAVMPAVWLPTSVSVETGRDVDPTGLLSPILMHLDELWQVWSAGQLEQLREAWSARDACRGRRVQLLPGGLAGVADGIDATGALRVRLPDGRVQAAFAGELTFVE